MNYLGRLPRPLKNYARHYLIIFVGDNERKFKNR